MESVCQILVAKQLKDKYAPFCMEVYDFAHKLNLAFKSLSSMGIMPSIEDLLSTYYNFSAHNPKKVREFLATNGRYGNVGTKVATQCLNPLDLAS